MRLKALVFSFVTLLVGTSEHAMANTEQLSPVISHCQLENTERVYFSVEGLPKGARAVLVNVHLFDSRKVWMADELLYGSVLSAPILGIAGLLDPKKVASVTCSIDGIVGLDQRAIIPVGSASAVGRKSCRERDGLDIDGGPDADVEAIMLGRNWMMVRFSLFINHFFPNVESNFNGDVFLARLDNGPDQKMVVSGPDPQSASYLFSGLSHGLHQVDYGPWFAEEASSGDAGYHNVCVLL